MVIGRISFLAKKKMCTMGDEVEERVCDENAHLIGMFVTKRGNC